MSSERVNLLGLPRAQLETFVAARLGAKPFRARQLMKWIYRRGAADFSSMTDLAQDFRAQLTEIAEITVPQIVTEQSSKDGTRKWMLRMDQVQGIETVYIPEPDRGTLCISSQVGCTLNCSFCHTGTQRLVRNLTAAEIAAQVVIARDRLADWTRIDEAAGERKRLVSNVVMMGMGEPLYNLDAVRDGLNVVADGDGLSLSKRRITLSTSGVVPNIARAGTEIGVMLAVSLHAVTDELRNELVPLNRKYPLRELLDACRNYPGLSNARRITFEYVMLKGINDSLSEARALVRLLNNIPAKINLIPFNPWPGTKYECSDWEQIEKFSEVVFNAGYASPVRTPRGRDILAACGQLKSATEKLSARERLALRAMAMTD